LIELPTPVTGEIADEFKKALAEPDTADKELILGDYGPSLVHCCGALIVIITIAFHLDVERIKHGSRPVRARTYRNSVLCPSLTRRSANWFRWPMSTSRRRSSVTSGAH
jgi:hypothetical protein